MRMNSARGVLSGVILAAALAGCMTVGDQRYLKPVPPKLVASMQAKGMMVTDPILLRVFKKEAELEVWKRDRTGQYALLKTYPVCRWSGQLGPKMHEGDRQTPEGFYTVRAGQMNPNSAYYLSFDLGFPNALDRALGRTGSALMIHGACSSSGCFAMTDDGAAELFALAREAIRGGQEGFQVQSYPFRMTPENLAEHRASPHIAFWRNLKEGSDHFEAIRRPPKVASCGRRYVFNVVTGADWGATHLRLGSQEPRAVGSSADPHAGRADPRDNRRMTAGACGRSSKARASHPVQHGHSRSSCRRRPCA
jgi:murein L,D-transpeptidase YafK